MNSSIARIRCFLIFIDLFQNQFSEEFGSVRVGFRGLDRVPAEEVRMSGKVSAFVEIPPQADRKVVPVDSYQLERISIATVQLNILSLIVTGLRSRELCLMTLAKSSGRMSVLLILLVLLDASSEPTQVISKL